MTDAQTLAKAINENHSSSDYSGYQTCVHCGQTAYAQPTDIEHRKDCPVLLARKIVPVKLPPRYNSNDHYCGRDS